MDVMALVQTKTTGLQVMPLFPDTLAILVQEFPPPIGSDRVGENGHVIRVIAADVKCITPSIIRPAQRLDFLKPRTGHDVGAQPLKLAVIRQLLQTIDDRVC